MNILKQFFGTENSNEDRILSLIEESYLSFSRINGQNNKTDIEGKILLLSSVYEIFSQREGIQSQSFNKILKMFIANLDYSIIKTVENNGVGPIDNFIIERCKLYEALIKFQIMAGRGAVPIGLCCCLYKKPLDKFEYKKGLFTKDGFIEINVGWDLFFEHVRKGEGLIATTDEYSLKNLDIVLKFVQTYFPTRIKFEQKLIKII